jgi:hypothetical protein
LVIVEISVIRRVVSGVILPEDVSSYVLEVFIFSREAVANLTQATLASDFLVEKVRVTIEVSISASLVSFLAAFLLASLLL